MKGLENIMYGLTKSRYEQLKKAPFFKNDKMIMEMVRIYGADLINRGYDIFVCVGDDVSINNALIVEQIDELKFFENDFLACRQAEKDGIKFINDVDGLEKGCYVDTPENRNHCVEMLEKHPEYRIENWLTPDEEYYNMYREVFGEQ